MPLKVSILIPVYNGEETLSLCLDSLMDQDYPKNDLEVIVIDNNSIDRTKEIVSKYPVTYLFEARKGEAFARNTGIKKSSGSIIAFLDADCIAQKDWLKNLLTGFSHKNIAGCGGKITYANLIAGKWQALMEELDWQKISFSAENRLLPWLITENAAFRKDIFDEVGLFDESFIKWCDIDLSWRIWLKGYRLNYAPYAKVYHILPRGVSANFKRTFNGSRNCWKLWKKYKNVLRMKSHLWPSEWFGCAKQFCCRAGRIISAIFLKKIKVSLDSVSFEIASSLGAFFGNICGNIDSLFKNYEYNDAAKPVWNNQPIWREVDGEIAVLNPLWGNCYLLRETGAEFWRLLMDNKSEEEIVKFISDKYSEGEEKVRGDYYEFMDNLRAQHLIN